MARMPQVSARELVRFLKAQGSRRIGSRDLVSRCGTAASQVTVIVPGHTGTDLGRGLAVRILKDAGFSVDESLRLP